MGIEGFGPRGLDDLSVGGFLVRWESSIECKNGVVWVACLGGAVERGLSCAFKDLD